MATKKINHITYSDKTFCPGCGNPQKMYWYDNLEKNGFSETYHTFKEICRDCYIKQSGKHPKTLQELNDERILKR